MKKIYLCLAAAVAVLSSCVEEKILVPVQNENQLTINAIAGNTKTVLNETSVLWENNDAVKVVFKSSTDTYYVSEFTTSVAEVSASASFTGTLDAEATVDACGETGFAVYPSSVEVESDGQIEFEVSNVQNGVVGGGNNLSYAEVSLAELRGQKQTTTTFHNALSLIKVTVPDGVKKVTLASKETPVNIAGEGEAPNWVPYKAPLTGTATFYYTDGALAINPDKWSDSQMVPVPGTDGFESVTIKYYSVVLEAEGNTVLDNTKTYDVLVFPGLHKALTVTVEGDGCTYSKDIEAEFNFYASQYYTLDIANIFSIETNEFFVSPLGGEVEVPVVTTLDDYQVNIPADATWLTLKPAVKGAFRNDVLTFTATENALSATRSANVTVTSGDKTLAEFTVTQENYVPELLGEYLESYTKNGMSEKGTLKIELSDNFSEGLYKVTICGSVKYANYENGKLNIYDGKYTRTLTVSSDFSKLENSMFSLGSYTISNYVAIRPLGAPELTPAELAIVGVYNETWTHSKGTPAVNGMEISASEEAAYGNLYVKFLVTDNGGRFEGYATLNNNTLTVPVGEQSHSNFGKIWDPSAVLTLTVNDNGTITMPEWTDAKGYKLTNYVATKVVEDGGEEGGDKEEVVNPLVEAILGEYTESWTGNHYIDKGKLIISKSDDASKGDVLVKFGFATQAVYGMVTAGTYGGSKITVNGESGMGPVSAELESPVAGYLMGWLKYWDEYTIDDFTANAE